MDETRSESWGRKISYGDAPAALRDAPGGAPRSDATPAAEHDAPDGALTPRSTEILMALTTRPRALPELRRGLGLSSARLSFLLRRLKQHGLITVDIDGLDRRVRMAAITEAGRDHLAQHRDDARLSIPASRAATERRKAEAAARAEDRGRIDIGEEMLRFVVDAHSHFAEDSRPEVSLALIQALTILKVAERKGGAACVAETSDRLRAEMRRVSRDPAPRTATREV